MIQIPLYRDLPRGDQTVIGHIVLDENQLPPDPFYSIGIVSKKVAPFAGVPVAASLVDDFNMCAALNNMMLPGQLFIASLMATD